MTAKPPREERDPAFDLLHKLGPRRALSDAGRARIEQTLEHLGEPRALAWRVPAAVAVCAAVALLLIARRHPPPTSAHHQAVVVPSCASAQLLDDGLHTRAVALGPAQAETSADGSIDLGLGRLIVTTTISATRVRAHAHTLSIAPESFVEVTASDQGRVRVAAFRGQVAVEALGKTVTLIAGSTWEAGTIETVSRAEESAATSANQGGGALCVPSVTEGKTAARTELVPPAHERRAPKRDDTALTPPKVTTAPAPAKQVASDVLERAIVTLRTDHDPHAALQLLDTLPFEAEASELTVEATLVRLESLQALNDDRGLLQVLDAQGLPRMTRGWELLALRADLRARAHRCRDANADYGVLLDGEHASEAAYMGRAACFLELGDRERGTADLRAYLARYPQGRYTAEAKRALANEL